jgi:hypothetical protein
LYKKDFFFNPFLQFAFKYYFTFFVKFYNYFSKITFFLKVNKNYFLLFFKFLKNAIFNLNRSRGDLQNFYSNFELSRFFKKKRKKFVSKFDFIAGVVTAGKYTK